MRLLLVAALLTSACEVKDRQLDLPDPDAGSPENTDAGTPPVFDGDAAARLQTAAIDAVQALGIVGATWAARAPNGSIASRSAGLVAPGTTDLLRSDARLRIGSITKTFVAVVVFQLISEGKLTLDTTAADWVANVPNGDRITVRQLLSHTSGLADFLANARLQAALETPHSPAELVAYAAELGVQFEPGDGWAYANTNYVVLGMMIGAVTGKTWAAEVRARILDPLHLEDTWIEGLEPAPAGGRTRGFGWNGRAWVNYADAIDPTNASSAGAIVSTSTDLLRFGEALFHGSLVTSAQLALMRTPAQAIGAGAHYGMGLVLNTLNVGAIVGHSGAIHGFEGALYWLADRDWMFATLTNVSGNGSADAVQKPIAEAAIGESIH